MSLSQPLSTSPKLIYAAVTMGTGFLFFGLNAILRPSNAITFFANFPSTTRTTLALTSERTKLHTILTAEGIRNIYMALSIYLVAFSPLIPTTSRPQLLGYTMVGSSIVAFFDGLGCKLHAGEGEWDHWRYGSVVLGLGLVLLGVFDRV
jgi:hypothetical protein